ncbi:MAG: ATP-binding protein [Desulfobacteraceae bacterium]|jgi:lon-related putative ATP-dependent protease
MPASRPLAPSELRKICDPVVFKFQSTADIDPLDEVIGQERAVRAINLGLNMHQPGYNIFITGLEGTGKRTIVQDIIARHARHQNPPQDWCMVNNFSDEFRPNAICVPTGKATLFSKSMARLIRWLQIKLPKEFASDAFKEKISRHNEQLQARERTLTDGLEQLAKSNHIHLAKTAEGVRPVPLANGKPMTHEQFDQLPKEQQTAINQALETVGAQMEKVFGEVFQLRQAHQKTIQQLMQDTALAIVRQRLDLLRSEYADCDPILAYLNAVQQDIIDEVENFISPDNHLKNAAESPVALPATPFDRYKVNVLVDHKGIEGAPVVFEPNPSFQNLFGYIDKKAFMGATTTDFTMVQAGSLLQANGGYLIVEVESLLMDAQVWESLKRSLQNKQLYIQDVPRGPANFAGSLRPEPIPLDVKVILVGHYKTFELLQNHDPKFNKIFKVRSDFDYETDLTDKAVQLYARFIAGVCRENDLRPFSPDAVAAIVEFGAKTVADQSKLSLRFGPIVGIIQEADYWSRQDDAQTVTETHVIKALSEYRFRYNLYEEKIHASYADDTIFIDVAGAEVGQVNALAVYQVGELSFGRPSRITAETFMGKHGIVNIEREAEMSGNTHDKGVMILSGYLGRTFAQKYPLSLSISITFEQSYSGVDGDSASSTELYAILSSLSGVPIRQGIAVTGSVNQKGQVQAIGGVNQKIEGFYEVCKTKGLNGHQGVMIPKSNAKNLMLKREVVQAVEKGEFNIYPVETIQEGIEILTGIPAGVPDEKGDFAPDTVYGKVQKTLVRYLKQSLRLKALASK